MDVDEHQCHRHGAMRRTSLLLPRLPGPEISNNFAESLKPLAKRGLKPWAFEEGRCPAGMAQQLGPRCATPGHTRPRDFVISDIPHPNISNNGQTLSGNGDSKLGFGRSWASPAWRDEADISLLLPGLLGPGMSWFPEIPIQRSLTTWNNKHRKRDGNACSSDDMPCPPLPRATVKGWGGVLYGAPLPRNRLPCSCRV